MNFAEKQRKIFELDQLLRGTIRCTGLSIGDFGNKQTYKVDFLPEATSADFTVAESMIDEFDNSVT